MEPKPEPKRDDTRDGEEEMRRDRFADRETEEYQNWAPRREL